jgi:DNA polymerase III subunit alpha
VMAVLVESVRFRTSARGNRYMLATLSDPSGQFEASCFDDGASADLEAAARAGGCALINVELDRRSEDETPRVAVRRVQPLETLAGSARLKAVIVTGDVDAVGPLAVLLSGARGGRSEVFVQVPLDGGREATLSLGRDFLIDGELADAIGTVPGVESVSLTNDPLLRLVS